MENFDPEKPYPANKFLGRILLLTQGFIKALLVSTILDLQLSEIDRLRLRCYEIGDVGRLNDPFEGEQECTCFGRINGSASLFFRTVGAEITQETGDFFVSNA